jgi:hypothetical protein
VITLPQIKFSIVSAALLLATRLIGKREKR